MFFRIISIIILITLFFSCSKIQENVDGQNNAQDVVTESVAKLKGISSIDSLMYVSQLIEKELIPVVSDSAIAAYYYQTGILCYRLSGFEDALRYFVFAEKFYRNANLELKATQMLANQAVLQELKGNYKEAVKIYITTAEVFKQHNDSASWASALGNIGVVYEEMGMAEKAIYYDKLGLDIKLARHDTLNAATNYNNIGVAFSELLFLPDSAIYYYTKAFKIYKDYGHSLHCAQAQNNLGMLYIMQNKFALAKQHLEKADYIFDSVGNLQGKGINQRYFGELNFAQGNDLITLEYFKNAMDIFRQINDKKSLMEMGTLLSKVYISMGNYPEATQMMQYANTLKDSLMNNENKAIIADMESKYQLKEKNKTIEVLKLEEELNRKQIRNQLMFISLLIVVFVLIFVIFYYNSLKNKLNQKQLRLELQNYLLRIDEMKLQIEEKSDSSKFSEDKIKEFDLSEREAEVLTLISHGYKNSEIAEKLFVSQNTIKTHIKNIYVKLDVKNRVEALKRVDIV